MAMEAILELQKLEVPQEDRMLAPSSTSSFVFCCNPDNNG